DVTYNNHCQLNPAASIAGRRIRKKFKGTCEGGLVKNAGTACGCRLKCPSRVRPVCGNDDVTYNNHCELNRAACIAGRRIRKK
ncbi:hypothetical protein GH868_30615, partial [Bacillus thuringiensis]|nr:hypothetical protein [Bacillus thuringiensis]